MSQLSELRTGLRQRIGNPTTAQVTDATLNEHLNSAYRDIASRYGFSSVRERVRFNTVAGTNIYDLTSTYPVVLHVWDRTNRMRLVKIGIRGTTVVDDGAATTTTQGKPLRYARFGTSIQLYPIPDGAYQIEAYCKRVVAALVNDVDTPTLPETWHDGIKLLGRWYYYDSSGDLQKAQFAYQSYKLWLSDKPSELAEETTDIDSGVELPTLSNSFNPRLDWDHENP